MDVEIFAKQWFNYIKNKSLVERMNNPIHIFLKMEFMSNIVSNMNVKFNLLIKNRICVNSAVLYQYTTVDSKTTRELLIADIINAIIQTIILKNPQIQYKIKIFISSGSFFSEKNCWDYKILWHNFSASRYQVVSHFTLTHDSTITQPRKKKTIALRDI